MTKARDKKTKRKQLKKWKAHLIFHYGPSCMNPECRKALPPELLTIDHIIPRAQGGSNELKNLQLLCAQCNVKKDQDTTNYRQNRMRLGSFGRAWLAKTAREDV